MNVYYEFRFLSKLTGTNRNTKRLMMRHIHNDQLGKIPLMSISIIIATYKLHKCEYGQ